MTPNTFNTSSPASSSSQNASKLRRWSKQTAPPRVPTAIASATPPNLASRNSPHAPIARFIILGRLTAARTPPAPREDTRNLSLPAAQPYPPTVPTAAATMMPSRERARPGPSHLHAKSPRPTSMMTQPLPSTLKKMWKWTEDGPPAPSTPEAPRAHPVDLTTPHPLRRVNAPTGRDGPPPTGTGTSSRTSSHSQAESGNE